MNRRHFLKYGGVFLTASLVRSSSIFGSQGAYKAAIIGRTGAGNYGHGLDRIFNDIEDVTVVAVADPDEAGRTEAMNNSGAQRGYADYERMLRKEQPELVAIAPRQPRGHHEMALAALDIGAHLYMEKPITEFPAQADDIVNSAEANGLKVAVAHHRRYGAEFLNLKKSLEDGIIGTVLEMACYGKQDTRVGGEDLIVLGTHDFDSMRYYFGDPLWCSANVTFSGRDITPSDIHRGREPYTIAGNTVRAQFAFPNNMHCTWTSIHTDDGWNQQAGVPWDPAGSRQKWGFDIYGTRGIISYRANYGMKILHSPYIVPGDDNLEWSDLSDDSPAYSDHITHPVKNLIYAIENDCKVQCSAKDALWTVEMVSAVYQSQIEKKRISFPLKMREHPLKNWT